MVIILLFAESLNMIWLTPLICLLFCNRKSPFIFTDPSTSSLNEPELLVLPINTFVAVDSRDNKLGLADEFKAQLI